MSRCRRKTTIFGDAICLSELQDKKLSRRLAVLIGYARVSTQDQNLFFQHDALKLAGCQKIFEEKQSGNRTDRPGLVAALETRRDGDTLVVWKLDCLGRSVKELINLVGELHDQGIQVKSLADDIDTGTPTGRFFFHVMASLEEAERELTVVTHSCWIGSNKADRPQEWLQAEDDRQ